MAVYPSEQIRIFLIVHNLCHCSKSKSPDCVQVLKLVNNLACSIE